MHTRLAIAADKAGPLPCLAASSACALIAFPALHLLRAGREIADKNGFQLHLPYAPSQGFSCTKTLTLQRQINALHSCLSSDEEDAYILYCWLSERLPAVLHIRDREHKVRRAAQDLTSFVNAWGANGAEQGDD